jgi:uncharacterized ubiquitin-like protein YukD
MSSKGVQIMYTLVKTEIDKNKQAKTKKLVTYYGSPYDVRVHTYVRIIKRSKKVVVYVWNSEKCNYSSHTFFQGVQ